MQKVAGLARPFFYEGPREKMCLLIHGFSGSPSDMHPLGEYLRTKGFSVSGMLLPGHGTTPEDMAQTTYQNWYEAVEREYLKLKKDWPSVIPIGLSMGGLLSFHLAHQQQDVSRIVSLSAPIFLGNRKAYYAPLLRLFYNFHKRKAALNNEKSKSQDGCFAYDRIPLSCVGSLLQLIKVVQKELPVIKVPTLIIQSKQDFTVNPKSAQYIYEHLQSKVKELVWLEKSGHVITRGEEKENVFKLVEEFLARTY